MKYEIIDIEKNMNELTKKFMKIKNKNTTIKISCNRIIFCIKMNFYFFTIPLLFLSTRVPSIL